MWLLLSFTCFTLHDEANRKYKVIITQVKMPFYEYILWCQSYYVKVVRHNLKDSHRRHDLNS